MKSFQPRALLAITLIAIACLCGPTTPAFAALFKFYYKASAQSGNTVKIIRNGYLYSGASPNVITMAWDAAHSQYEAVVDDASHINDYWRIEDGSGNVVADSFNFSSTKIDADQVEDLFVRNDGDDTKRGNLLIIPASGTTNVGLLVDNSSGTIVISATDTASVSTTGHAMKVQAASAEFATSGGAPIVVTGIQSSATANSVAPRSSIDTLKSGGSGPGPWTVNMNLVTHESRLDALEGTGTFTANDSLFLTGGGGQNILSFSWAFDPVGVNDSIDHVEVRYGPAPVPGYSQSGASSMSTGSLSSVRSILYGVIYPERGNFTATLPSSGSYYVIVLAFDHTSPTKKVWGSNQVLITGNDNPIDASTPLVGDATNVVDAVEQLANELATVINSGGTSSSTGTGYKVWYASSFVGTAAGAPTEVEWYQAAAASALRIYFTFYKDATYNTLRLRYQSKHSAASKDGTFYLGSDAGTASKTLTHSATPATWQDNFLVQDISTLSEGLYVGSVSMADGSSSTSDTLYLRRVIAESYNQ